MASEESLKSRRGLEVGLRAQQRTSLEQIINSAQAGSVFVLDSTCISMLNRLPCLIIICLHIFSQLEGVFQKGRGHWILIHRLPPPPGSHPNHCATPAHLGSLGKRDGKFLHCLFGLGISSHTCSNTGWFQHCWFMQQIKDSTLSKATIRHQVARSYGLPRWLSGKESACHCRRCKRRRFDP